MSLEISMCENSDIRTEIGELRAKYEDLVVQCERLVDENEQLRTYKEHLTEELDRIGNCQPSCRLNTCDYAAILSSKSPSISSSFAVIC